jgi:hypothetical protein
MVATKADWYVQSMVLCVEMQRSTWRLANRDGIHMTSPYHPNPRQAVTIPSTTVNRSSAGEASFINRLYADCCMSLADGASMGLRVNSTPRRPPLDVVAAPSLSVRRRKASSAALSRPLKRRYRGDSTARKKVAIAQESAGSEHTALKGRQPPLGITDHAVRATATLPSIQNAATMETAAPRTRVGMISDTNAKATGTAPPTPQPVKKRQIPRAKMLVERENPTVNMAFKRIETKRTGFLPQLSAAKPAATEPASIPIKTVELRRAFSLVDKSMTGST